jgi:hypothetical protein
MARSGTPDCDAGIRKIRSIRPPPVGGLILDAERTALAVPRQKLRLFRTAQSIDALASIDHRPKCPLVGSASASHGPRLIFYCGDFALHDQHRLSARQTVRDAVPAAKPKGSRASTALPNHVGGAFSPLGPLGMIELPPCSKGGHDLANPVRIDNMALSHYPWSLAVVLRGFMCLLYGLFERPRLWFLEILV